MSWLEALDHSIIQFFGQFAGRWPGFDILVGDVADSALLKGGLFMAYFWWLWFMPDGDVAERRRDILLSIAGALAAVLVSRIVQRVLPYHERPLHAANDIGFVLPYGVNPATLSDWSSFPSDHAALFMALAVAIWYRSRLLGVLAAAWALFVICVPRIYLGFHYPSDVIAGSLLGIAIMVATHRLARNAAWTGRILPRWEGAHRMAFYAIAFVASYEITVLFYDLRTIAADSFNFLRTVLIAAA